MIKAEEALNIIKNNYPSERYSMLREAVDFAIELLELQRTPTFDEVVKTWELVGDDISVLEDSNGVLVHYDSSYDEDYENNYLIFMKHNIVENINLELDIYSLQAINLTIRYLEGQKEK